MHFLPNSSSTFLIETNLSSLHKNLTFHNCKIMYTSFKIKMRNLHINTKYNKHAKCKCKTNLRQ